MLLILIFEWYKGKQPCQGHNKPLIDSRLKWTGKLMSASFQ